jgi:transcriptional regulator with XRE-family HTH domain
VSFGERYKQCMATVGMRNRDVCAATGMERAHVSHILAGTKQPTHDTLRKMVEALPYKPDLYWLLDIQS